MIDSRKTRSSHFYFFLDLKTRSDRLKEDKKLKDNDPALRLTGIRPDVVLQEAAATCIFNIRRLALVNELVDNE